MTYGAPTTGGTSTARLYRNDGGNTGLWLHVRPVGMATAPGNGTNRSGVGVRVETDYAGVTRIREVQGGFGYHTAMSSMPVEFGFGAPAGPEIVERLRVRWTTGQVDAFDDVPMGEHAVVFEHGIVLRKGTAPSGGLPVLDPAAKLFPYREAALGDGQDAYYLVDWETRLTVDKDETAGEVILRVR